MGSGRGRFRGKQNGEEEHDNSITASWSKAQLGWKQSTPNLKSNSRGSFWRTSLHRRQSSVQPWEMIEISSIPYYNHIFKWKIYEFWNELAFLMEYIRNEIGGRLDVRSKWQCRHSALLWWVFPRRIIASYGRKVQEKVGDRTRLAFAASETVHMLSLKFLQGSGLVAWTVPFLTPDCIILKKKEKKFPQFWHTPKSKIKISIILI